MNVCVCVCVCADPIAHGRRSVNSRNAEKSFFFFFFFVDSLLCLRKFHDSTLNKFEEP